MAVCKRLQAALGNLASVAINVDRICDQAAKGDEIAPERIVWQLCAELVGTSPMIDEQLLRSCRTSSSTQPGG